MKKFRLQLVFAIFCSVVSTLLLGFAENSPSASIIGAKSFGYPLAWRTVITAITTTVNYDYGNLIADLIFWFFIFLLLFEFLYRRKKGKIEDFVDIKKLVLYLMFFVVSALVMAFVHEFGHAFWGIVGGGKLELMQIGYFVIFPTFELTSKFQLGYVLVTGFSSEFWHGLFLLGGALTTNLAAWLIGKILLKKRLKDKSTLMLKTLGIIGFLDLPFYVFLPQIGLHHWIFIGGKTAEPLIGAREMQIPDPIFYFVVLAATFLLILLYFKTLRQKVLEKTKEVKNKLSR